MTEIIQKLFGEFGLWMLGIVGVVLTASITFLIRQFRSIKPKTEEVARSLEDVSDRLNLLVLDVERYKREIGEELDKITVKDDSTRKRLDDIHARLDHFVGQTVTNYQALSEQIASMQRGLLGKQDDIIEKQAELLRRYQERT